MLSYLRDKFASARLQAKYQRIVQERLLELTETHGPEPISEDPGKWTMLGDVTRGGLTDWQRIDYRLHARKLVNQNPHARQIIRLLEAYVTGPGLKLNHHPLQHDQTLPSDDSSLLKTQSLAQSADRLWTEFLTENEGHFAFREHARRAWRDGETFVRKFSGAWPTQLRFVDPEQIGPTPEYPTSQGILTDSQDVETRTAYLKIDPLGTGLIEEIPAAEMLHTRVGVDSNQKRGLTILLPVLEILERFEHWVETELLARKLQASIVLWRKVQGSPTQVSGLADGMASGGGGDGRREKLRPGTILTTNHSTEFQFLSPNTNFGDAVPLGRMLLLNAAAGCGLPEFMLTSDASNANFASTMVAEGPAVKFFESEQNFFEHEFTRLWRWVMRDAVAAGLLPEDFFEQIQPHWTFPELVNRDRAQERLADVQLVQNQILSRAEVGRRENVDPQQMRHELAEEASNSP